MIGDAGQITFVEPNITKLFEIHQKVGKGAYGVVFKVVEKKTRKILVLKKCFDCFQNTQDAQRTYREVAYLKALRNHENIVQLQDVYCAENGRDLYLTFDRMPTDLHVVIRSNILLEVQVQYIIYQIFKALKYIHSAGLIHRDIKPSNVLVDASCRAKLCDFGLCRSVQQREGKGRHLTDYVATRWYRPPEVLLCSSYYSEGIDIWAAACILGEMIRSRPIFAGCSTMHQIEKILQSSESDDVRSGIANFANPIAKFMLNNISIYQQAEFGDILGRGAPEDLVHLMRNCMTFDPANRYTAVMALSHCYLSDFHNPEYEQSYQEIGIQIQLDDNKKVSADQYRRQIELGT